MPLIVTFFWGLDPAPGMLLVPLFAFVTALGFAGFGVAMAATVAKIDQFNYVTALFVTPLFLVAGTFFPISGLPEGVQVVAQANPLHQLVELVRGGAFGFERGRPRPLRLPRRLRAADLARRDQPHGQAADRLENDAYPSLSPL